MHASRSLALHKRVTDVYALLGRRKPYVAWQRGRYFCLHTMDSMLMGLHTMDNLLMAHAVQTFWCFSMSFVCGECLCKLNLSFLQPGCCTSA